MKTPIEINQWLTTDGQQGGAGGTKKGQKECLRGDSHYLGFGDESMHGHTSKCIKLYTFKKVQFVLGQLYFGGGERKEK